MQIKIEHSPYISISFKRETEKTIYFTSVEQTAWKINYTSDHHNE